MPKTRYASPDLVVPFRALPSAALRACLREGYGWEQLRADVLAGLVVGVVALPLSMALAIAVGAPPQHGLNTAIVAGLLVGPLGGSRMQVTGPTAAFVVILAPVYMRFGLAGLTLAGLMSGLILIGMALARMGKLLRFVPHPVTTGFTGGIAVVIATMQLKDFLGLRISEMPEHYVEKLFALALAIPTVRAQDLAIGVVTLALLLSVPKLTRKVPAPLVALSVVTVVTFATGFDVATIGSRFPLEASLPQPGWPWALAGPAGRPFELSYETVRLLLPSAFAIAMLGAIESLLSAVVADGMAGTKHDPDAELFALGIGNVVCPFFGGIACTGAIARTATNIRSGARSPIASVVHAVVVLLGMVVLAPALRHIPMAALAGLLLLVAWNMSDAKHFVHTVKVAPKSDVMVLLTCFGLTVVFDMVIGVSVGIVLAALLFMRRMAEVTRTTVLDREHPRAPRPIPKGVVVYDIAGPLFFGAAEKAMSTLGMLDRARVIILDLDEVHFIDATGLVALESALGRIEKSGAIAILCGLHPQPESALAKAKLADKPGKVSIVQDLSAALDLAERATLTPA